MVAIGWIGLHSLRYGGSDVSLIAVGFFGFMGALLTMLFGSILIWWIWHFINNLLQKASLLYSVDQILIGVGIFIVIFALFYFATWIIKVSNKQPVKS